MKLTVENALTEYPKVRKGMPENVEKVFNNEKFAKMFKFYGKSEQITKTIDMWLEQVNAELAKRGDKPKAEPKPKAAPKPKTEPKPKATPKPKAEPKPKTDPKPKAKKAAKPKAKKEVLDIEYVKDLPLELRYIYRYTLLDGKDLSKSKVLNDVEKLLRALQTSIVKGLIRKSSTYAVTISLMQKNLIEMVKNASGSDTLIDIPDKEDLRKMCRVVKVDTETTLQKAYIRLIGNDSKNDIKRLIARFDEKYGKTPKNALMQDLYDSLNKAHKNGTAVVPTQYGLSGLKGLL